MRLTPLQRQVILEAAKNSFGDQMTVRLFGSRTDDTKQGGDIDLLVESPVAIENKVEKKCRMAAYILKQLGEQKIDILVLDESTPGAPVYTQAKQTGIPL